MSADWQDRGWEDGLISHRIREELLDVRMPPRLARMVADRLWRVAKKLHSEISASDGPENPGASAYVAGRLLASNRATRMCYELLTESSLTGLSAEDVSILYDIRLEADVGGIFAILNLARTSLRSVGDTSVLIGDSAAKNIFWVMAS